jgi:hypothetical protein
VRFFIILDCFEQYLRAPFDRAGIAEFDAEFVRMVNEPRLATSFLLSVRADAEALLNRYRERINGFGDAFLRLPDLHRVTAPSFAPDAQTHLSAAATTPIAASETLTTRLSEPPTPFVPPAALTAGPFPARAALLAGSDEPVRSSTVNEGALRNVQPPEVTANASAEPDTEPGIEPSVRELVQPYASDQRPQFTPVPKARGASPAEAAPVLIAPPELRRPARSPARISLAAIVAGFAIGAGAGYFAVYGYQGISTWQTASSAKSVVPATGLTAGLSTTDVPVAPADDVAVAPADDVAVAPADDDVAVAPADDVAVAPADADDLPVAPRADQLVPPPSSEPTSAVRRSAPAPRSPTRIKSAKATSSPTPKVTAPIAPPAASPTPNVTAPIAPPAASPTPNVTAPIAPPAASPTPNVTASIAPPAVSRAAAAVIGWQTAMHRELEICRQGKIFKRVVCTEKARWKHCAPDRWNTIPECAAGNTQVTRSN